MGRLAIHNKTIVLSFVVLPQKLKILPTKNPYAWYI